MSALVNATPNQTMSSREIADLCQKEHKNVLRVIRDLIDGQILAAQIEPLKFEYRGQWFDYYELNKRDSLVTVARLSPEFTAAVVDRWQELEAKQTTFDITNPVHLLQAIEVQARLNIQLAAERDHAIATKHLIGSKREATAMANTATANRKLKAIEAELGRCIDHATILAVQNATGCEYSWRPLKAYCTAKGIDPVKVHCPRFKFVQSWPAEAWLEVHGVDIVALFGEVTA